MHMYSIYCIKKLANLLEITHIYIYISYIHVSMYLVSYFFDVHDSYIN